MPGLIPIALVGYGVIRGSKLALLVGGVWIAFNLLSSSSSAAAPRTLQASILEQFSAPTHRGGN